MVEHKESGSNGTAQSSVSRVKVAQIGQWGHASSVRECASSADLSASLVSGEEAKPEACLAKA